LVFSLLPRCQPGRVRVGEVDPQPGGLLDAGVLEHLVALVPGQRAPKPWWQHGEGADQRVRDAGRNVPAG
jgi:hypothetical protein